MQNCLYRMHIKLYGSNDRDTMNGCLSGPVWVICGPVYNTSYHFLCSRCFISLIIVGESIQNLARFGVLCDRHFPYTHATPLPPHLHIYMLPFIHYHFRSRKPLFHACYHAHRILYMRRSSEKCNDSTDELHDGAELQWHAERDG